MIQVDEALGQTAHHIAFAFVVGGGIIGEDGIALCGQMVEHIHVAGLATCTQTVGENDHGLCGNFVVFVQVSHQGLALVRGEGVALAGHIRELDDVKGDVFGGGAAIVEAAVVNGNGQTVKADTAAHQYEGQHDGNDGADALFPGCFHGLFLLLFLSGMEIIPIPACILRSRRCAEDPAGHFPPA